MGKNNTKNRPTKIIRDDKGKFVPGTVSNGTPGVHVGRETVVTPSVLERLYAAFRVGATDEEACDYAQISTTTLYEYQKKHPEYAEQKAGWKREPILKAKTKVVGDIETNVSIAQWYLERKAKKEFGKEGGQESPNVSLGAPQNEKEAELLELVLNKHSDYVNSKRQSTDT